MGVEGLIAGRTDRALEMTNAKGPARLGAGLLDSYFYPICVAARAFLGSAVVRLELRRISVDACPFVEEGRDLRLAGNFADVNGTAVMGLGRALVASRPCVLNCDTQRTRDANVGRSLGRPSGTWIRLLRSFPGIPPAAAGSMPGYVRSPRRGWRLVDGEV